MGTYDLQYEINNILKITYLRWECADANVRNLRSLVILLLELRAKMVITGTLLLVRLTLLWET